MSTTTAFDRRHFCHCALLDTYKMIHYKCGDFINLRENLAEKDYFDTLIHCKNSSVLSKLLL